MDETTNIRTTKLSIAQYLNPHFYEENRGKKIKKRLLFQKEDSSSFLFLIFIFRERFFIFILILIDSDIL